MDMGVKTHRKANPRLLGTPVKIIEGVEAEVDLLATQEMSVDERKLVHGGFTYGLADYAAMLSVNHPNVVLGKSESHFVAPVKVGDMMKACAKVMEGEGRRIDVKVEVSVLGSIVFKGIFNCYVLEKHVLDR
jgi:acyl-coenzyme A thioesterase PaaI-like protein